MPGQEFFARMAPQFAEHAGAARANAERQADVERLVATAEYECLKLRRELKGLLELGTPAPTETETGHQLADTAKAA